MMSNKKDQLSHWTILVLLPLISLITACDSEVKDTVMDTPTSGTINISVDESFRPVIEEQIKVYEGSFPGTRIIAHYKTEAACFKDLYSDTSNRMVIVTRGPTKKESRFYEDSLGYTPVSNVVAFDAITIVVNRKTGDTVFSINELKNLLSGKQKDERHVVFDGLSTTSTVRYAMDSILRGQKLDTSVVKAVRNSKEVLNYVASDPTAIGFVGISWIGNPEDTAQVKMLKKIQIAYVECDRCADSPYVRPSQWSIVTRRYPLVRGLYYILKENYSGLGSGFASFLKYERGQLIFRRAYLGPVMDFEVRSVKINQKL